MRRTIKGWLFAAVCMVMMTAGLAACNSDNDGWMTVKDELAGEWETDTWEGTYPQDIVQYKAEIQHLTDKHSSAQYAIYGIRLDGQQVTKESGVIGHPNGAPDNEMTFTDYYHSSQRTVTITWLDNTHTSVVLYDGKVFKKKK